MEEKRNICLTLAYDGRRYHGWQRQKGATTIQEVVEDRLQKMIQEPVKLIASGRTDAGVHALNQVCHFQTGSKIEPDSIRRGLNALTPADILIRNVKVAPGDFHARYSTQSKVYEYRILNRREPDPFLRYYTWHIPKKMNLQELKPSLSYLKGLRNFSAFRSTGSHNRNPVREMLNAELRGPNDDVVSLIFEASGFLRHMVRNIVGTLADVGLGRIGSDDFKRILESKDRKMAGIKAPPQGLFLKEVRY